jgi:positive regulator of sigma E activity
VKSQSEFVEESLMKDKNDLKLLDIMCKWYIWAVVGLVIGNWLSDTLGSHIGLAFGSLIGWYIQKNYNKKDNGQLPVCRCIDKTSNG